ncbi:hypothetical protein Gorai_021741, partial [Gossypium raimondii]|nr:hypothetical protein [Gossypium raimondii]
MSNLQNNQKFASDGVVWLTLFGLVIWRNNNNNIFQGVPWNIEEIIKVSRDFERQPRRMDHRVLSTAGKCSILDVELWGILYDLSLMQEKQGIEVLIQTNSLEAIEAIQLPNQFPQ